MSVEDSCVGGSLLETRYSKCVQCVYKMCVGVFRYVLAAGVFLWLKMHICLYLHICASNNKVVVVLHLCFNCVWHAYMLGPHSLCM